MTIKDESNVDELLKAIKSISGKSIDIGIIGDSGSYPNTKATTLDIGTIHEFGSKHSPERSFIRASFDQNTGEFEKLINEHMIGIIEDGASAEQFFELFGQFGADVTKKFLTELSSPPNSPITIKLKGSSNPLIDTGQLRNSIVYEVK